MFDEYAKKLEELQVNAPKIFKRVALLGANYAVKKAKEITDNEGLVDTGNYRRNWFAERVEPEPNTYGVELQNTVEYASHLEYGHKTRGTTKVKGKFVGQQALDDARYYCIKKLDDALDRAFKKYHESFTKTDE